MDININLNLDALNADEVFELMESSSVTNGRTRELLNKCIVGGLKQFKGRQLKAVMSAVVDALKDALNPKETENP